MSEINLRIDPAMDAVRGILDEADATWMPSQARALFERIKDAVPTAPDTQPAPASGEGPAHTCNLTYRSPDCPGCMDMSPASGEGEALLLREFWRECAERRIESGIDWPAIALILLRDLDEAREKVRRVEALHVPETRLTDGRRCGHDAEVWPCSTIRTLGGEQAGDGGREGE